MAIDAVYVASMGRGFCVVPRFRASVTNGSCLTGDTAQMPSPNVITHSKGNAPSYDLQTYTSTPPPLLSPELKPQPKT
jgi:hypothetical protein